MQWPWVWENKGSEHDSARMSMRIYVASLGVRIDRQQESEWGEGEHALVTEIEWWACAP